MVDLYYNDRGFSSAFGVKSGKGGEGVVVFNTLWQAARKSDLYVSHFFRTSLERMAAEASMQILHAHDFVIDPKGFMISIDEDWETKEKWEDCVISPPLQLSFLPGCGLVPASSGALGQFEEDRNVLELYVGRKMTPALIVNVKKNSLGVYSRKTQSWEPRLDKKDILRELITAATASKYAEEFHLNRIKYLSQKFEELTR